MTYVIGSRVNTYLYGKGRILEKKKDSYRIKLEKSYEGITIKTVNKNRVHLF